MTTSHVEVPGGSLFVVDEGSGPPIALLHAGIADTRSWNEMVPLLIGRRVLASRGPAGGPRRDQHRPRRAGRELDGRGSCLRWRKHAGGPGQSATRVPAAIRELVRGMDLLDPSQPQGKPMRLDPPASERLAELRCPILAVAGEIDVSEVAVTARHLEVNGPNARALIWPDVAHMIGMEQPARLTDAIVAFLAPLEPWR